MTKPRNTIFTLLVKSLLTNCKNFRPVEVGARISTASGSERVLINGPMSEAALATARGADIERLAPSRSNPYRLSSLILRALYGFAKHSVYVDSGAIYCSKATLTSLEREKKISACQHDGLRSLLPTQIVPDGEQQFTLLIIGLTGGGHSDICVMGRIEALTLRQNDFHRGDAAVYTGLHHDARAQ